MPRLGSRLPDYSPEGLSTEATRVYWREHALSGCDQRFILRGRESHPLVTVKRTTRAQELTLRPRDVSRCCERELEHLRVNACEHCREV